MPDRSPRQRGPADEPARRGRRRSAETDRRIHSAALRLLHDDGPLAGTVEAVGELSGVAKTTIYRRYPNRAALLRGALSATIGEPDLPPDDRPRPRISWAL